MIAVFGFVLLGLGAVAVLTGLPRVKRPVVDPALFERGVHGSARLACAACGAAPLLMLSVAYAGYARLPVLLGFVVLPAYAAVLSLGLLLPTVGRRAVTGFLSGIVAVLAYDCTRLALSYSQGGTDPIPHIGTMLAGPGAPWWLGYLWRTLGNGAGLGIVFAMLCPRAWWRPLTGLLYASCVGLGMLAFLFTFPQAQAQLFKLTWQTGVNSALGHGTYGLVLGLMCRAAVRREARRAGLTRRHAAPDEGVSLRLATGPSNLETREPFLRTSVEPPNSASRPSGSTGSRSPQAPPPAEPDLPWDVRFRPASWSGGSSGPSPATVPLPPVPTAAPRRHARGSRVR